MNRPKPKAIVTDVDQVLLDYEGGLGQYFSSIVGRTIPSRPKKWGLEEWLGISRDSSAELIYEFSKTHEFGCLDAYPGADKVLHRLVRGGYRIICVTACGVEVDTVALRMANLRHRFGDIFEEVIHVNPTDSKLLALDKLSEIYDITMFIDDNPGHLMDAESIGITNTLLMKSPSNKEWRTSNPECATAFSWYDCAKLIEESEHGLV